MNTEALTAAFAAIEKAGGPKWYPWCDLEKQAICGSGGITRDMKWVHCPPAVEAAVVAYAYEVIDDIQSKYYAHSFLQPTRWSVHAVDADDKLVCNVSGVSTGKLAAAEALILAVAGEVG